MAGPFEAFKVFIDFDIRNQVFRSMDKVSGGLTRIQRDAKRAKHEFSQLGDTLKFIAGGMALGGVFLAVKGAAQLQESMAVVQTVTGGTADQMARLNAEMTKASQNTMFSTAQAAQFAQVVATSTSFTAPELANVMPTIMRFADVMKIEKGQAGLTSVTSGVQLAHLYGAYNVKELSHELNVIRAVMDAIPGTSPQFMRTLMKPIAVARMIGANVQSVTVAAAELERMGAGSRGGTALANMMIYGLKGTSTLTSAREKAQADALKDLGIVPKGEKGFHLFKGNKFQLNALIAHLAKEREKFAAEGLAGRYLTDSVKAFGLRGFKSAGMLTEKKTIEQGVLINKRIVDIMKENLAETQDKYANTLVTQKFLAVWAQLKDVLIQIGTIMLPEILALLKVISDGLRELVGPIKDFNRMINVGGGRLGGDVYDIVHGRSHIMKSTWDAMKGFFDNADSGHLDIIGARRPSTTHYHIINLDGKELARTTTKHQADMMSGPLDHSGAFNSGLTFTPVSNVLGVT